MGLLFFCIKHVKMCKKSEFQVNSTDSSLFVKRNRLEDWGRLPYSKNSFWGHFLNGVRFSEYFQYFSISGR